MMDSIDGVIEPFELFRIPDEVVREYDFSSGRIIRSDVLSKHLMERGVRKPRWVDVDVWDFSAGTLTRTHKILKAKYTLQEADEKNMEVVLLISSGSAKDAFEFESGVYYPHIQVVNIVNKPYSQLPYCKVEPVYPDFWEGPLRIDIGLPLKEKYYSPRALIDTWKAIASGKRGLSGRWREDNRIFDPSTYQVLHAVLDRREIDYTKAMDGTNIRNFSKLNPYSWDPAELKGYNLVVVPLGIGEIAEGFGNTAQGIGFWSRLFSGRPDVFFVPPTGHPLDPFNGYADSDAMKLATRYWVKQHDRIKSMADKHTFFRAVTNDEIDFAYGLMNVRVIPNEHQDMACEPSAASTLGIFGMKPEWDEYGLRIEDAYQFRRLGLFGPKRATSQFVHRVPHKSKILLVSTGNSNNTLLPEMIEKARALNEQPVYQYSQSGPPCRVFVY